MRRTLVAVAVAVAVLASAAPAGAAKPASLVNDTFVFDSAGVANVAKTRPITTNAGATL